MARIVRDAASPQLALFETEGGLPMPVIAELVTEAMLAELEALRDTDLLMRQPGGLPSGPAPVPLHRMAAAGRRDHDQATALTRRCGPDYFLRPGGRDLR